MISRVWVNSEGFYIFSLLQMAIVKTSWQKYLSPDSEIPHDVFFVVKSGIDGGDSSNRIGAHKVLLAGASPVFTRMFFGPMKEEREEFEVEDTTYEMFNTMINYIYQPPGYHFFPSTHEDDDDDEEEYYGHAEGENNLRCPQKFFDLLNLAEYYQISSLKQDLSSKVLNTLDVRKENLILAATVAKKHQGLLPFDEISTKVLAKCLRFLLQRTRSRKAGDLWSQFWAVVNDSKESLKSRLAGTLPVADLRISFPNPLKYELDQVGRTSYENCLYLACSGIHVRWRTSRFKTKI